MNRKCLYCYQTLTAGEIDYHKQCSKKFFGTEKPPRLEFSLDEMASLAAKVLRRGKVIPGVQPKISMHLIKDAISEHHENRLTIVGVLGGDYIFKPPNEDYDEMPQNEHLTMLMAKELFGIKTADSSLVRLASGELGYLTKRMDRTPKGNKFHMLDMFQILEAYDKYVGSMEKIAKAIAEYSENPLLNLIEYYQLVLYCFMTGNNDMHLKNFSMLSTEAGIWNLSPAYDLLNATVINPEDNEELALPINAKKKKLKRKDLFEFGIKIGLIEKQVENSLAKFVKQHNRTEELINNSFLSVEYKEKYKQLLNQRLAVMTLI